MDSLDRVIRRVIGISEDAKDLTPTDKGESKLIAQEWAAEVVKNLTMYDVSQRSELLAFIAEVDKKRKEYPIAHDEQIVDMILKANCG